MDTQTTVFKITGDEIVGGETAEENQAFLRKINRLEDFAMKIGKTLAMSEVSMALEKGQFETIGFRFAESTGDRFDVKGIAVTDSISASEFVRQLV